MVSHYSGDFRTSYVGAVSAAIPRIRALGEGARCHHLGASKNLLYSAIFLLILAGPAFADSPMPCPSSPEKLGVSRLEEIDTTEGPTFGEQYPGKKLLKPGEVVLTFDDGPFPEYTEAILGALAAQCTKATFFNVGSMAKNHPEIARNVLEQGHTIGTHTWSHANLAALSTTAGKAQIERAIAAEDKILPGGVAPFFRFPYLSDSRLMREYLRTRGIAVFSIDVDSMDYRAKSAEQVVRNVMTGLAKTGGGIILFHDIHAVTAKALPLILEALKKNNFKVVHLISKTALRPIAVAATTDGDDVKAKPVQRARVVQGRKANQAYKWTLW